MLVDVRVRNEEICGAVTSVILGSESAAFYGRRLQQHAELLDPPVREGLKAGTLHAATNYIRALRTRTVLMEEMRRVFQTCDVPMLPAGTPAPLLEDEIVDTPTRLPRLVQTPSIWQM